MKNFLIYLLLSLLFIACKEEDEALPELIRTLHIFNGSIGIPDNSSVLTTDGNLVNCGNLNDQILLNKIDLNGSLLWEKKIYLSNGAIGSSIIETSNGDFFLCGTASTDQLVRKEEILLVKTNSFGDTIWTKTFGTKQSDEGRNIIGTSDNNILLAGTSVIAGSDSINDIHLIKLDLFGAIIWDSIYPKPGQEEVNSIIELSDGGYLVTGVNKESSNVHGAYILKVNNNGEKVWDLTRGRADNWKEGVSTIELKNGQLVTCGETEFKNSSSIYLLSTDNNGNLVRASSYGDDGTYSRANSIAENRDGTLTLTGYQKLINTNHTDVIVLAIDSNITKKWSIKIESDNNDTGVNLMKGNNDDNIITGNYNGQIFMTKINWRGERF